MMVFSVYISILTADLRLYRQVLGAVCVCCEPLQAQTRWARERAKGEWEGTKWKSPQEISKYDNGASSHNSSCLVVTRNINFFTRSCPQFPMAVAVSLRTNKKERKTAHLLPACRGR